MSGGPLTEGETESSRPGGGGAAGPGLWLCVWYPLQSSIGSVAAEPI